jgi:uncharacterized protein
MFFDPLYLLFMAPVMLLAIWAQMKVSSAFAKYSKMENSRRMTGAEAAADMLARAGVPGLPIEQTEGFLSDHYDPRNRTLYLSPKVFSGRSVAAVGVACHEAGHALQHAQAYPFMGIRSAIVPVASFGSQFAFILIFLGLIINMLGIAAIGVILFGAVVLFQLVNLPVEYNASSRAKAALIQGGVVTYPEEVEGVNKVLDAAALTYVAATITALAQLLYYIVLLTGRRR